MSEPSNQGEPTMEEILASIRKIISEDGSEADTPAGTEQAPAEADQASEDVLELTERVEDEFAGSAANEEAEIDAILASVTEAEDTRRTDIDTAGDSSGGIVSPETERAVTSALSDFAGALVQQNKDQQGPVGGNQTLDSLVRAALEPYLKSWLDEHLETLVERVLKEEIKRMARRAEDI